MSLEVLLYVHSVREVGGGDRVVDGDGVVWESRRV